ncbi:MAG: hypothetical protein K8F26_01305 [Thiobacillus sp.]|nr:hypothetical protein [Thiobacillus sp.]
METISKLDAARRHLDEAIRLFFEGRDSLAIHTLTAAAQGILRDVARATGAQHVSILHDHPHISPEHRKDWVNAINAPRNFFKHADNDPNGTLEFDEAVNESLLLDAVLLYGTVAQEYLSAASVYMGWFTTKNPGLRGAISGNQVGDYCVRNGISPNDKERFLELIGAKLLVEPA